MAKRPTLLQHFRSFVYQNSISDMDTALQYFAVFGGTGWQIDTNVPIETLIKEKILCNYEPLHQSMTRYTHNNPVYHHLLSIIASGIEHEHDAFQKARIGKDRGEEAIDYLEHKSLLAFDLSIQTPEAEKDEKSDRLIFSLPFMRFWFAMVSPFYRGIAVGDFEEFGVQWAKARGHFHILLSNLLMRDLARQQIMHRDSSDPVVSAGSYYDRHVAIDILAKTKSGKSWAGTCKYATAPAKAHMLEALKEKCQKSGLETEGYLLFAKHGFTPELKAQAGDRVILLTGDDLGVLLEGLSEDDLLAYKNRKY